MLLSLLLLVDTSHAGCGLDAERDARWAAAPLVLSGTVTHIRVTPAGGVQQRVAVDTVYKGGVDGDAIWLDTNKPHSACPSPIVFPIGATVYAVGALDEDGAVGISPCWDDVGRLTDTARLADTAALQPETAAVFHSPEWRPPAPPPPLGDVPVHSSRFLIDGTQRDGHLGDRGAMVVVGDMLVSTSVTGGEMLPVVSAPSQIYPGASLLWRAGALIADGGQPALDAGWHAVAALTPPEPSEVWVPSLAAEPKAGEWALLCEGDTVLHTEPGGAALLRVSDEAAASVRVVAQRGGWSAITVTSASVAGTAWVREERLCDERRGGVAGGIMGSYSNTDPLQIELPAGAVVRWPGGGPLAQARAATWVDWLAQDGERAWVVVEGPRGPLVGEVRCAEAGPLAASCVVAAP